MVDLKDLAIQSRRFIPALSDASNDLICALDGLQSGAVISNVRGKYRNRGGGLSVYYPYSLNNYNTLASDKPDKKDGKKTPAFESLGGLETDFDEETQRAFVRLTEEQLNSVYNVHAILLSVVKIEDETVLASMGIADDRMVENWAERKFEVSFNGELFLFEGEGLYVGYAFDATERDEDGIYSIIGAVKTSGNDSLPDNSIVGLKKGDRVKPIYSIYPLPKDLPQEFSFGDYEREIALPTEIVLSKHPKIKKKILTGDVFKAYIGFFIFQNEFGNFERSRDFSFYMEGGKWKAKTSR